MDKINHVEERLEFLHFCLMKDSIPNQLPKSLEQYQDDFTKFNEIAQTCNSSNDKNYINALKEFSDILLKNVK